MSLSSLTPLCLRRYTILCWAFAGLFSWQAIAESPTAVLGEVDKEASAPPSSITVRAFPTYKRVEWQAEGNSIKQFSATATGHVFAVAWRGALTESVHHQLGVYDQALQTELARPHKRGGRIPYRKITAGGAVFEIWNVQRMVKGRAIVPTLKPESVSTGDID